MIAGQSAEPQRADWVLRWPDSSLSEPQRVSGRTSPTSPLDRTEQRTVRVFHKAPLDPENAARYSEFGVDAPLPLAAAIRLGEVIVLVGEEDYRSRFPDLWADTAAAGLSTTVSVPLLRADDPYRGRSGSVGLTTEV